MKTPRDVFFFSFIRETFSFRLVHHHGVFCEVFHEEYFNSVKKFSKEFVRDIFKKLFWETCPYFCFVLRIIRYVILWKLLQRFLDHFFGPLQNSSKQFFRKHFQKSLNISPETLSKLFKRFLGKSFYQNYFWNPIEMLYIISANQFFLKIRWTTYQQVEFYCSILTFYD